MSERYARQVQFPGVGPAGQAQLSTARVLLVGCGALGTVLANLLVRAGVGRLTIADRDYVEPSNLQRQVLFDDDDAARGRPKALAAAEKLRRVNPEVQVEPLVLDVNPANVAALVAEATLVLDGTDNFETRYLLNDACVQRGVPWVYAAAVGAHGATLAIVPSETPCLRCLYPDPPPPGTLPTCETDGVLAPAVGVVANLAAAEALKLLVGARDRLRRALVWLDVWTNAFEQLPLAAPRPDCPCCGQRQFVFLDAPTTSYALALCGRNTVQVVVPDRPRIALAELAARLTAVGPVRCDDDLLRLQVEGYEITVFPDARALIKGTTDLARARALYSRYIGA
ncbi:MAG TPA: ThiF family adenylyltransferase [Chloroflexota bacterium]|nr:ThiF family adenylyltransferase [Chloroflexota bacterium]